MSDFLIYAARLQDAGVCSLWVSLGSARKRAALGKANAEAERLRQKLALAETMVNVWKSAAEYAARIADERYAALAELVALKAMKDEMSHMLLREEGGMGLDYDRRNPLAWERARELVGSNANVCGLPHGKEDK